MALDVSDTSAEFDKLGCFQVWCLDPPLKPKSTWQHIYLFLIYSQNYNKTTRFQKTFMTGYEKWILHANAIHRKFWGSSSGAPKQCKNTDWVQRRLCFHMVGIQGCHFLWAAAIGSNNWFNTTMCTINEISEQSINLGNKKKPRADKWGGCCFLPRQHRAPHLIGHL